MPHIWPCAPNPDRTAGQGPATVHHPGRPRGRRMDGTVILEEHFATEATLGDLQQFGAHVWTELRHRLLDFQDQRLRLMDESGVAIMILSLNAPAVQAIYDVKQAIAVARQANDLLAAEVRKRPDRFAGLAALPMQDPEAAAQELHALRQGARLRRRARQRLLAGRRSEHRGLLRSPAVPAVLGGGREPRRPVLSAPAQPAAQHGADLRRPSLAARPQLGIRCRDRGARAAADRQRPVRPAQAARHRPRAPGRGAAVQPVAHRQPQWLDEGAAQVRGARSRSSTISAPISTSPRRGISARRRC